MPNDEKLYISQVSDSTGDSPVLYAIKDAEAVHKTDEASYGDIYGLFSDLIVFIGTEPFTLKTSNGKLWNGTIEYSTDKTTWTEWDGSSGTEISSGTGNVLYLRGKNNTHISATSSTTYSSFEFTTTGTIACTGDIRTLLDYEDPENTTMDSYCYAYMFRNCRSLAVAPELPATTLASGCYNNMFYNCTSLTNAPALPATTLASGCYAFMFQYCTSITTVPELPATTLATECYNNMFYNCTSLTNAPALPATTLAGGCYNFMFYDCISLTTIPALPATTLANSCYRYMFGGCRNIKLSATQTGDYQTSYRIPTSETGTVGSGSLSNMFASTGGTFTGTPTINATYYTSNTVVS